MRQLVGFKHMAGACANRSRNPIVCYHPRNRGDIAMGGGPCVKDNCPIWAEIQKANSKGEVHP